jgi:hypothetical protein
MSSFTSKAPAKRKQEFAEEVQWAKKTNRRGSARYVPVPVVAPTTSTTFLSSATSSTPLVQSTSTSSSAPSAQSTDTSIDLLSDNLSYDDMEPLKKQSKRSTGKACQVIEEATTYSIISFIADLPELSVGVDSISQ